MSEEIESPIRSDDARKKLGIGTSLFSAIKRQMGISGRKYVILSEIKKWRLAHAHFKQDDVYHRPDCKCAACLTKRQDPNFRGRHNRLVVPTA